MGQGKIPLVVFPGQAEISPRYAYKNLLDRLGKKYKIYTVEPLGYGLSDMTDKPRTIENITKESRCQKFLSYGSLVRWHIRSKLC